jgi:hypothetical protein
MTTNTPMADALMSRIRDQYPHESVERHRKRFIEIVRNGDPNLREEIVNSLFGVFFAAACRQEGADALKRRA